MIVSDRMKRKNLLADITKGQGLISFRRLKVGAQDAEDTLSLSPSPAGGLHSDPCFLWGGVGGAVPSPTHPQGAGREAKSKSALMQLTLKF
jgi:hypothetical protein